jgi:hypothetical protein
MPHFRARRPDWQCDGCRNSLTVGILDGRHLPIGWTSHVVHGQANGGTAKVLYLCPDCSKTHEAAITFWRERQNTDGLGRLETAQQDRVW